LVKKQKMNAHHAQHHPAHHAPSKNREMFTTIIMTVVITVAVLVAGFLIINALKDSSWSLPHSAASGSGKVTMIEYSDFQCPFCGKAFTTVKQLQQQYGDKLEIVYKQFPLPFHPFAEKAAEASLCAGDQGKFWDMHDLMFTHQDALAVSDLKGYASHLNLDTATFNTCLDSGSKAALIQADIAEGQKLGVSGTPTFFINGQSIVGAQPIEAFTAVLDKALGSSGSSGSAAAGTGSTGTTTQPAAADTSKDPIVYLTVVNDSTCASCDPQRIIDITTQQLFPTAKVVVLDKDSDAGQKLISDLKLTALPAYIFSSNVAQAANFAKVSPAMTQTGDYYVITPGAAGPVRFTVPVNISGKELLGFAKAPITIIEFSDFQCPYCKQFHDTVGPQLKTNYIDTGKVKMVYMEFPLDSIHPFAHNAALAAECAAEQNKFWAYHDLLFSDQTKLAVSDLKADAATLGLNATQFNDCLDSKRYDPLVTAETQMGQSFGIQGTPGFLVNGIFIGGTLPYDQFAAILDSELNASK